MIKKSLYLESAPAKINLFLEVFPKENPDDSHHKLATLFQAIELADYLSFEVLMECSDDEATDEVEFAISIDSNDDEITGLGVNNIVVKAIELFFVHMPEPVLERVSRVEVAVFIDKNIPIAAGLAGGSSNAAATLRALNKFIFENFNSAIEEEILEQMAFELGADVPFCLGVQNEPRVYVQDFEIDKSKIQSLLGFDYDAYSQLILVKPEFGINTAEAYAQLSPLLKPGTQVYEPFFNRFETSVLKEYPELAKIKKQLLDLGCDYALLSGSGSTMIGFVSETKEIDPIYQDALNKFPKAKIYKSKMLS